MTTERVSLRTPTQVGSDDEQDQLLEVRGEATREHALSVRHGAVARARGATRLCWWPPPAQVRPVVRQSPVGLLECLVDKVGNLQPIKLIEQPSKRDVYGLA